ncbi:torsin-1A-like [Anomaloglossus baeobatrachus]|uniref:torsin-1A-like n=1 Tax=Anomaloglossus baeobatrachus TaxID=238106 RepID=UPI003F5021F8
MKPQDFYQLFTFMSSIIKDYLPPCDPLACYGMPVARTCECCLTDWSINITALQCDLDKKIFGQHLAKEVILKTMQKEKRLKPLVLSFHGLTGSGKTYMSQILAKHFNPRGAESQFVHKIVASVSFPHKSDIQTYKDQLHAWIRGNVSRCEHSLFVLDDIDKMHPELLHSLKPYLDYHDNIDGVSYKKSIFIFMSNTGANIISDLALAFQKQVNQREEIRLFDVHNKLSNYLLTSMKSEYYNCDLIKNSVIDIFVPFLPLELEHVKMCIRAELKRQGRKEDKKFVSRISKRHGLLP